MLDIEHRVLPEGVPKGVETVPAPSAPATPAAKPDSVLPSGSYEDALKKLGITPQPTQPEAPVDALDMKAEVAAMVENISGIQAMLFSLWCMSNGTDKTPEVEKHLVLSDSEQRQLRTWGPSVLPYWKKFGLDKNLGPIFFCGTLMYCSKQHYNALEKLVVEQRKVRMDAAAKLEAEEKLKEAKIKEIEAKAERAEQRAAK